ncbi:uncharacterized protein [Pseudorasbora parva]|uniref:uncharacterized protein n=1 Tax=Pseudorasbora parva TaxID=51549 RepID=UPI00351DAA23
MESVGVNVIKTAALGRSFELGMLYDCRKDALVPGIRPWKIELNPFISSRPQVNTRFTVSASDSIQDKSELLNIDGGMSLSVLGGLIEVSGAAKYLKDTKKSFIQQRLTLHYNATCEFKELIINHLPSMQNMPDNYNDIATHVVTGVLYGANAYFIFDRKVESDEDKTTVEGELKVAFEKLKGVSVNANVNLKMDDNQKNAVKKLSCTFYGDFQLLSNPTSFEDSMTIFAELPTLLKENQKLAVPLRVWLYPLEKLNSRESKLLKDISIHLITKTESVIESLNTAEMKCCDLMEDSPARTFAAFYDQIEKMKKNCCTYKLRLVERLHSLLPNIRGEVMQETALNDLLQENDLSPFRASDLTEWLKERERESEIIKSVLRRLKDAGAQVELNVDAVWMGLEDENLVSYTFTSLDWSDMLLSNQNAYLNLSTKGETVQNSPDSKQKSWLTDEIKKSMKRNLKMFETLINSKDSCKPAKFIVSSREIENYPGSCIFLYESECNEAICFTPPSKPARPIIEEVKGHTVVLKVPPSCPATVELRLLYKPKQDTVWTSEPVLKGQLSVTLTDLRAETEYEIKCAAMGKLNYTRDSDVIHLRVIEKKLLLATDSVIENLSFTENKCSELLKDTRINVFTAFRKKIEDMKQFCQIYRQDFNKRSQSLIRSVQACEEETCALTSLLQAHGESPFNTQDHKEWIKAKEKEINTVGEFLQQLLCFGAEVNTSLDTVLSDIKVENVVCYTFSSLEQPDELLSEQENYMKAQTKWKNPGTTPRTLTWLSGHIRQKMKENVIMFKELMTSHDSQSTKFIVSSKEIENHLDSCILLYKHGCGEAICFTPPSKPARPIIEEVQGQTVVLKVPPSCPATVELRLLYKPKQDTVWTSEPVLKDQLSVTLTDLRAETEYEIKCAAMGKLNYTRDSDVIHLRVIEKKLLLATDSVIENLSFTENKCSELLKDTRINVFTAFRKKIEDMKQFCQIYRQDFNKRSQSLIRSVQACEEETCALTSLLQAHGESPFNTQDLKEWIKVKEKEINTVGEFLQQLLCFGAEVNTSLDTVLSDIKVENVVCYTFSSLEQPDELLSEQENYMEAQTMWKNPGTTPRTLTWLSGHIRQKMKENVTMFKELMTSHDSQSTKFIVSSKEIENHLGSCILLYEHGCGEAICFTPPSKPARPIIEEVQGHTVVLKVPPSCPATVELRLLYKPKQDTVWTSEPVLKGQLSVTLTDLRAETEYEIKCAAMGKLNYTRDSDVIRVTTEKSTGNRADKDPVTRSDLLQYSLRLTPDLNTVNKRICLSEGNREITLTDTEQPYPDHPDRFEFWPQVLSRERVCGRSYWEVEWSGYLFISVSYQSISRKGKGDECGFGLNAQSLSLECSPSNYLFWQNDTDTVLPVEPISSEGNRVGVYVDLEAGTLSFYSVSGDSLSLIHSAQTTFTEPLYAGFRFWIPDSSVKLL